ncbi:MAG: ATP-binding protein, partial [Pseudomonadota bacterium]
DWDEAESLPINVDALETAGETDARFSECPPSLMSAKAYAGWAKAVKRWFRQAETITIYRSSKYRINSTPGESEGDFRARLQQAMNEKRDQNIAKLRKRFANKATTLENRVLRAQQRVDAEKEQATQRKLDTALSFGTAILGAVLGRKRLSSSTATKVGSAIRRAGSARKQSGDVDRARETLARAQQELETLNQDLEREVGALEGSFDAQAEELKEIIVRAKTTDIHVALVALAWMPYSDNGDGRLTAAWKG